MFFSTSFFIELKINSLLKMSTSFNKQQRIYYMPLTLAVKLLVV